MAKVTITEAPRPPIEKVTIELDEREARELFNLLLEAPAGSLPSVYVALYSAFRG